MHKTKCLVVMAFVVIFALTIPGCELFDRLEKTPSYIHIESIELAENIDVNEGSLSSRIVDAWVYVNDQLIGAFELPCTFPVLMEGEVDITIMAGIYLNGVKTTRVYYPFFDVWKQRVMLHSDSIIEIKPEVKYSSNVKLPFHENFEIGGVLLEDGMKTTTSLLKTSEPNEVFEGNYSGKIVLNDTDSVYVGVSIDTYVLPTAGGSVFVELDYKSEANIVFGVYAIKTSQILQLEVAGVLPKNEWSKIYLNLTPVVYRNNDALGFKLFIGSYLPEGVSQATVLIDNIKLIHL